MTLNFGITDDDDRLSTGNFGITNDDHSISTGNDGFRYGPINLLRALQRLSSWSVLERSPDVQDGEDELPSFATSGPSREALIPRLATGTFGEIRLPEYAPLRNAGLVDYWRARGWPDLCRPVGATDFVCD